MSSFWTSPTSPIAAENDPRKKIQDFKARLSTAKQKLNDLRIPMMKETLARIEDFLEVCEKSKGDNGPITEFINLLTRFIDDVLDPVSKENQRGEVRITGVLAEKIRILLTELYQVIPQKDHISALSWNRMDHGVDVSGDLAIANPRINDALQTFMYGGFTHQGIYTSSYNQLSQLLVNDDLEPTLGGVMQKFRILLLGKSGVGKSSLIQTIFKIPQMDVAHYRAGIADIDKELTSKENPHFILHDSLGFEARDDSCLQTVTKFIKKRNETKDDSEHIHAIWLCIAIPVSGGHAFELGDKVLLNLSLDHVPLIIVFTQYDVLVDQKMLELRDHCEIDAEEELMVKAQGNAENAFKLFCMDPLRYTCKRMRMSLPPVAKVSVRYGYEETLLALVQLTQNNVSEMARPTTSTRIDPTLHTEGTAWMALAKAQRVDAKAIVQASIEISRNRIQNYSEPTLGPQKRAFDHCLDGLHEDIVLTWNLYDPSQLLTSRDFKQRMKANIKDMADSVGEPKSGLAVFISGIAKRVYDGRKQSPQALALQCLMAYIVDLSLVMRRLFSEMQGSQTISQHKLSEVLREYGDSSLRLQVHTEISIFVNKGDIHEPIRKDKVLDEVVELLEKYRFDPLDEAHESHNDYPFVDLTGFLGKLSQPPTATGGNSDVFKTSLIPGPHGHSEQLVAVQVLRCVGTLDDSLERLNKRLLREAHVWNRLNYIHVVPLLGLSSHGSLPCLITPWYENGNALNYISKNTEIDKSSLVAGCIDGVVYLHSRTPPVVHGDLKASNILVDNNGNARITDFGTSKILQEEPTGFTTSSGVHGTHRWMAPELLINSSPPSTTTDIYSLTLLVLEIYTQKIPFAALNQYAFFNAINKKLSPKRSHYQPFDPPEKLWRAFEKGWSYDPRQRPSALIFKAMFSATLAETGWRCS